MKFVSQLITQYPDYAIQVIGWSFGGAIATLCCEDIYYRFKIRSILVTFGSPKPLFGNKSKKYVRSCCLSVAEFVHINDLVPHLPPFNRHLNKVVIGNEKFNLIKLCKPQIYHCLYGQESIY